MRRTGADTVGSAPAAARCVAVARECTWVLRAAVPELGAAPATRRSGAVHTATFFRPDVRSFEELGTHYRAARCHQPANDSVARDPPERAGGRVAHRSRRCQSHCASPFDGRPLLRSSATMARRGRSPESWYGRIPTGALPVRLKRRRCGEVTDRRGLRCA